MIVDSSPAPMKTSSRLLKKLRERASQLTRELRALYLASQDPRIPWYARWFVICIVAYALSPIDLIPDPIPVLGYLDDLVLLPLGIYLALRMIPEEILKECRQKAETMTAQMPSNWVAAAGVVLLWIALFVLVGAYLVKIFQQ